MPNGADSFVALANLACLLGVILVVFALVRTVRRIRARRVPLPGGYAGGTPAVRVAHDYAKVPRIITVTEQSFYTVLGDAVPAGYTIMVQVALNRLVTAQRLPKTHYWRTRAGRALHRSPSTSSSCVYATWRRWWQSSSMMLRIHSSYASIAMYCSTPFCATQGCPSFIIPFRQTTTGWLYNPNSSSI